MSYVHYMIAFLVFGQKKLLMHVIEIVSGRIFIFVSQISFEGQKSFLMTSK